MENNLFRFDVGSRTEGAKIRNLDTTTASISEAEEGLEVQLLMQGEDIEGLEAQTEPMTQKIPKELITQDQPEGDWDIVDIDGNSENTEQEQDNFIDFE